MHSGLSFFNLINYAQIKIGLFMVINLQQLANIIHQKTGEATRVVGNSDIVIEKIATINSATKGDITFLANPKYKKQLTECNASAIILSESALDDWQGNAIVMDNPYLGFAITAQELDTTPKQANRIHPSAVIDEDAVIETGAVIGANVVVEANAKIASTAVIGAGCYIGQGTIISAGTKLYANVTIYHGVTLGENCQIHANSVIGADGFGYAPQKLNGNQIWHKIPQLGGVVIGDNTEIGASTTIDRGAIEDTQIGKGVILDNQIQLGHNVVIGDYTAIAAGTMIAGSTKIGKNVTIGGVCAISGHLTIVDNAFITGRTFVMKDITEAGVYSSGMPAATNKEWRNNTARYRKLTELFDRVKQLEKNQNN